VDQGGRRVLKPRTLEAKQQIENLVPSRHPAHAVVAVASGEDAVQRYRVLRKMIDAEGTTVLMKRDGRLYGGYRSPGQWARIKSEAARKRARKAEARRASRDVEPNGTRRPSARPPPTPRSITKEVVA